MPLSNIKGEGFQNKMAEVLGEAMGARVTFNWRPFIERGLTRQTFDQGMCDVLFDMPANYGPMLTTSPVYKTTYVLAYRNDKGLELTGLDDPKLKDLKIGVFQTSALRAALAKRGIVDNVQLQVQSHDADLVPEHQPWWTVQEVMNGELDVAGVFGPFAGWLKTMKGEPLTIIPVNLQDDTVPLEFDLAIGVRKTDAFLKYMLEFALDDKKDEIEKILRDYGVPLVQCSKCVVPGDLPAHGSYIAVNQQDFKARPDLASPDQIVTEKRVEQWLEEGADITQELSNAVIANDQERIKFLVGKGADVNKQDSQGYTPLTNAARQRQDATVKLLLSLKADPNLVDGNSHDPAHRGDHARSRADREGAARQWRQDRGAGSAGLPPARSRAGREQIRGGQGADGSRRRSERGLRRRRPHAADDRRRPERSRRGRPLRSRQHPSDRHRSGADRAQGRRQRQVDHRHDRADDRRGA